MKKAAFDHPYFDVRAHSLTEREAERLLNASTILSGREALQLINDAANDGAVLPENFLTPQREPRSAPAIPAKRLRIAGAVLAVCLALTAFFALTRVGVTAADAIGQFVVRLFDSSLRSQNDLLPSGTEPIDFSQLPQEFDSLQAVAYATGRDLVYPSNGDEQTALTVRVIETNTLRVRTVYMQSSGSSYSVTQRLSNDDTYWGGYTSSTNENMDPVETKLGATAYLCRMEDGTLQIDAFGNGYDITIASVDLTEDELWAITDSLAVIP